MQLNMRSLPFAELSRGVRKEHHHAMYSMRAMLLASEKVATSVDAEDLAGVFGDVELDGTLLALVRSNITNAMASAGLVFIHSAYENAAFDLIRRMVRYDAQPWIKHIAKKQACINDILQSGVESITQAALDRWLDEAEKQSFPWKVERLFEVLQPDSTRGVVSGFEFDIATFKEIDNLRHQVTHQPDFSKPIGPVADKLNYLHNTILLLEKLAEQKYPGSA